MQSKVTICVPVYGVEKYIERCARCLFEQTYEFIDYIFVDDCSPDNSIEILKKVISDYPRRKENVRIIKHDNNKGLAGARNTAVENCKTEFIMHVDSDDYIDLNTVEECIKNQKLTGSDIVTYGFKRIKNGITSVVVVDWVDDKVEMLKRLLRHKIGHGVCGRMIRTSLYKDHNIKVEVGRGMAEDLQVSPRLFYYSNKLTYINNVCYYYNLDNESSYVSSFSIDKFRDQMRARNLIRSFFSGQDEYLNAFEEATYISLANSIKGCARVNAPYSVYMEVRSYFDKYDNKYISQIEPLLRIVVVYVKNYTLLKMIISLLWHSKNYIRQFIGRRKSLWFIIDFINRNK